MESRSLFPPKLRPIEVVLLLLLVVATRWLGQGVCHVYDDAFITYRYALNLALGNGLVFNPGAAWEPVLGTTTPGYGLLLAGFINRGFGAVSTSLVINTLADVASAFLIIMIWDRARIRCAFAVIAFATLPELVRISMGGMEAPMVCFCSLLAVFMHHRGRLGLAGLVAAVACTLRPEAVLLVAVLCWESRKSSRDLVRIMIPVGVVGSIYTLTLIEFFGSPIPQSVISKANRHTDSNLGTWAEILQQAFLPVRWYLPLLPLVIHGMWNVLRERGPARLFSLFALGITASYLIARPHTWGWYFFIPMTAWTLWLSRSLAILVQMVRENWRGFPDKLMMAAPTVMALGAGLTFWAVTSQHSDVVTERVYIPMQAWLDKVQEENPACLVLASDIGALGYFANLRVLDTEGLVWPEALPYRGRQVDLVRRNWPDYLMITAVKAKIGPLRDEEDLQRGYYPVHRFSVSGDTDFNPKVEDLPDHWVQDYIVYRRRHL